MLEKDAKDEYTETNEPNEELIMDEEGEDAFSKKLDKLKKDLKNCQKEKQEYLDGWQRERATLTNLKKELAQGKQKAIQLAHEQIVSDIIPVLDSFNMAFANKEAWEKVDKTWRTGIEYIYNQLYSTLTQYGVTEFSDEGELFNPERHHSQEIVPVNSPEEDGIIIEVIQKGYTVHNSVLRPARVKVGEYKNN